MGNPSLALQPLGVERLTGISSACNVVVRETLEGGVVVSIAGPASDDHADRQGRGRIAVQHTKKGNRS